MASITFCSVGYKQEAPQAVPVPVAPQPPRNRCLTASEAPFTLCRSRKQLSPWQQTVFTLRENVPQENTSQSRCQNAVVSLLVRLVAIIDNYVYCSVNKIEVGNSDGLNKSTYEFVFPSIATTPLYDRRSHTKRTARKIVRTNRHRRPVHCKRNANFQ